jgi:hypothetical protein
MHLVHFCISGMALLGNLLELLQQEQLDHKVQLGRRVHKEFKE